MESNGEVFVCPRVLCDSEIHNNFLVKHLMEHEEEKNLMHSEIVSFQDSVLNVSFSIPTKIRLEEEENFQCSFDNQVIDWEYGKVANNPFYIGLIYLPVKSIFLCFVMVDDNEDVCSKLFTKENFQYFLNGSL